MSVDAVGECRSTTHRPSLRAAIFRVCVVLLSSVVVSVSTLTVPPVSDGIDEEFDDMLAIRHSAQMIFQLYMDTGDERFYQARQALIRDLPPGLFEPPLPRCE